ncbi:MAG: hypothetical protein MR355_10630 [Lachnospiraceae bacterium]|nr:hypothetical protein [Lachnospiraceae bacterium]
MEPILRYHGEFKKGRLGAKKYPLRLELYPSHIEGEGFWVEGTGDLSQYTISINIGMAQIRKASEVEINGDTALQIEYTKYQTYDGTKEYVIVLGVQNCDEWISAIAKTKEAFFENEKREKDLAYKKRLAEKEEAARKAEEEARLAAEEEARKAEEAARLAAEEEARKAEEVARLAAEALRAEEEAKARAEAEAKAAAAAKAREEAELQARAEAEAARAREATAAAKAAEEAKMAEERALEELAAKALAQAEEAARAAQADEHITAATQEETVSEPITHMGEEEAVMSDEKITVDEFKEKLDKLMLLKDAGILSEAEFSAEKAKLISLM